MDIGTVIGGAFRLIRDRPLALAAWSFLYLIISVAMTLAMRPVLEVQAATGGVDLFGRVLLIDLLYFVAMLVVLTAVQRAVLHPGREKFFYLRLGMDELRTFLLVLLLGVGGYVLLVLGAVAFMLLASSAGLGTPVPLVIVTMLVLFAFLVWLEIRLSLSFPLTMMRGRIVIGESWRLTRGRFWPLFGAYFVTLLILMTLWSVVTTLTLNSFIGQLAHYGFTPQGVRAASANEAARQLQGFSPMTILSLLVSSIVGVIALAIWGGMLASAAEALTVDIDRIAETFA